MGEHIPGATGTLHRSESGIRQLHVTAGASEYASSLARYIACPSTVRARTLEMYGKSPSIDHIRVMRARHVESRAAFRRESDAVVPDERDRMDFRVAPTVQFRPAPAEKPEPYSGPFSVKPAAIPSSGLEIITAIAREFGVPVADIIGPRRHRSIVMARSTCAYVLWMRGNSYTRIGRWLNGRDHSTIIHACRQFEALATPAMRELAQRYIGRAA